MASASAAKNDGQWSEIETILLNQTLAPEKSATCRKRSDWVLRVERVDPAPSIAVGIGYYRCEVKVEEVFVSGSITRKLQGPEVTSKVAIWTGPEKTGPKYEGFTVNSLAQTEDKGELKASVLVKYRRKRNCSCSNCGSKTELGPPLASTSPHLDSLSSNFEDLFHSLLASDVVFEVQSEEIPAHKLILTTRVPHFKALFDSGMKEAVSNRITVEDATPDDFKQVLKFIYCGRIPDNMEANADKYLLLADMYDMEGLKQSCVECMKSGLTEDNVIDNLILAYLHNCPVLKKVCFRFLETTKTAKKSMEPLKDYPPLMLELIDHLSSALLG